MSTDFERMEITHHTMLVMIDDMTWRMERVKKHAYDRRWDRLAAHLEHLGRQLRQVAAMGDQLHTYDRERPASEV